MTLRRELGPSHGDYFQVVVAGEGPVGMCFVIGLGMRAVKSLICEISQQKRDLSHAVERHQRAFDRAFPTLAVARPLCVGWTRSRRPACCSNGPLPTSSQTIRESTSSSSAREKRKPGAVSTSCSEMAPDRACVRSSTSGCRARSLGTAAHGISAPLGLRSSSMFDSVGREFQTDEVSGGAWVSSSWMAPRYDFERVFRAGESPGSSQTPPGQPLGALAQAGTL